MTYPPSQTSLTGVSVLEVSGADDDGRPMVRVPATNELQSARVVWMKDEPDWAACVGLRAVVAFPEEAAGPVLLGLLDSPPGGARERLPQTVNIESQEELVIQCGKSKIAMRADGRIEIRGGHLISRSSGPNKIKGGSVHIN